MVRNYLHERQRVRLPVLMAEERNLRQVGRGLLVRTVCTK